MSFWIWKTANRKMKAKKQSSELGIWLVLLCCREADVGHINKPRIYPSIWLVSKQIVNSYRNYPSALKVQIASYRLYLAAPVPLGQVLLTKFKMILKPFFGYEWRNLLLQQKVFFWTNRLAFVLHQIDEKNNSMDFKAVKPQAVKLLLIIIIFATCKSNLI